MSDEPELPEAPDRRALIIWYSDESNSVELYSDEFGPLEVPELLRIALDIAEQNLPTGDEFADDTEGTDE